MRVEWIDTVTESRTVRVATGEQTAARCAVPRDLNQQVTMKTRIPRGGLSSSPGRSLLAIALAAATLAAPAAAQLGGGTAIKGATVLVGDGTTIEGGTIVITGERITAVNKNARGPMMGASIDATGKFVTPGLIDAWSSLALRGGADGGRAYQRAEDAFDRYDREAIDAAIAQGVTTIYVPARTADGIGGLGAVLRLAPDKDGSWVLKERAALDATIGGDPSQGPIARVRAAASFRQAWIDAKKYRRAQEDYEEALKEYEEKIAERAKKEAEGKKDGADAGEKETTPPADPPGNSAASPSEPPPRPPRRGRRPEPAPPGERPQPGPARPKSDDEIKKPEPPPRDPNKDLLLEVLDGKLQLRVEVERPADLQNVLDVAGEFNLPLVLVGAVAAGSVADEIAERRAAVIQSIAPTSMMFNPGPARFASADTLATLKKAEAPFVLASGVTAGSEAARNLVLGAALAAGQAGLDADAALAAITSTAAQVLGVDDDCGRVARGMAADLVVWSAHPFDPAARVERVFIAGKEVFNAESREEAKP